MVARRSEERVDRTLEDYWAHCRRKAAGGVGLRKERRDAVGFRRSRLAISTFLQRSALVLCVLAVPLAVSGCSGPTGLATNADGSPARQKAVGSAAVGSAAVGSAKDTLALGGQRSSAHPTDNPAPPRGASANSVGAQAARPLPGQRDSGADDVAPVAEQTPAPSVAEADTAAHTAGQRADATPSGSEVVAGYRGDHAGRADYGTAVFADDEKRRGPELQTRYAGGPVKLSTRMTGNLEDETNPWAFRSGQEPVGRFDGAGEWSRRTDFRGELSYADHVTFRLENSSRDRRDLKVEEIGTFFVDHSNEWEETRVNDTRLTAGFLNDRLRISSAYSMSRFAGDETGGDVESGSQFQQGLAFDAWRSDDFEVTFFSTYGETDEAYEELSFSGKDKKIQNPFADSALFADPGHKAWRYGGEVTFGPGSINLAQVQSWSDGDENVSKNAYEAGLSLNIEDAAKRAGFELGTAMSAVTPDSVWMNYSLGRETSEPGTDGPENQLESLSFGSGWWWDGGYGSISYWTSFLDNLKAGAEDSDWEGQGLDLSLGVYRDRWGIYGGVGYSRSDSYGAWSRSWDAGVDSWLTFNYRPVEDYPMLNVSVSTSRWQGDYESSDGESLAESWSLVTELDFSRSADDWFGWNAETSSLALSFALEGESSSSKWSGVSDRDSDLGVFVGFSGRVGLYD